MIDAIVFLLTCFACLGFAIVRGARRRREARLARALRFTVARFSCDEYGRFYPHARRRVER